MKNSLICCNCKEKFEIDEEELSCIKCNKKIKSDENFIDFSGEENFEFNDFPKLKLKKLLEEIEKNGYTKATGDFLKNNPIFTKQISDIKSADIIFHCLKKKNIRCLEIGSEFGKNIEILSKIFKEVYSLEWNEQKIEFQKKRFKENGITNVKIIRCDPFDLPFPKNHFDLVISNGLIELIGNCQKGVKAIVAQKRFLQELKRVIKNDGCFSLGVENGSSLGSIVEKDIPYRKFEKFKLKHSFQEYQKIFSELGLYNNAYWALPSLWRPYFSGKISDKKSIKWFYENYNKFLLKEKQDKIKNIALSSFGKINDLTLNIFAKRFVPNFVFCCYKSNEFSSYEEFLLKKTKFSNFILMGRRMRLIYVLFNKNGKPKNLISLERFGVDFPDTIEKCDRIIPNMKDPSSRVWIENWVTGKEIDPNNIEHLNKAMVWLMNFQKQSKHDLLSEKEKNNEVSWFRKRISNFPEINNEKYIKWLEDYEKYILENKIIKVARHGDFWYTNILFDKKTNQTNVIDWENFSIGNPFYDFLTFILHVMTFPPKNPVKIFEESLDLKGISGKFLNTIIKTLEEHFGFKFDLILLVRFFIIRNIIRSKIRGKKLGTHIRMLEILSDEHKIGKLLV